MVDTNAFGHFPNKILYSNEEYIYSNEEYNISLVSSVHKNV